MKYYRAVFDILKNLRTNFAKFKKSLKRNMSPTIFCESTEKKQSQTKRLKFAKFNKTLINI